MIDLRNIVHYTLGPAHQRKSRSIINELSHTLFSLGTDLPIETAPKINPNLLIRR